MKAVEYLATPDNRLPNGHTYAYGDPSLTSIIRKRQTVHLSITHPDRQTLSPSDDLEDLLSTEPLFGARLNIIRTEKALPADLPMPDPVSSVVLVDHRLEDGKDPPKESPDFTYVDCRAPRTTAAKRALLAYRAPPHIPKETLDILAEEADDWSAIEAQLRTLTFVKGPIDRAELQAATHPPGTMEIIRAIAAGNTHQLAQIIAGESASVGTLYFLSNHLTAIYAGITATKAGDPPPSRSEERSLWCTRYGLHPRSVKDLKKLATYYSTKTLRKLIASIAAAHASLLSGDQEWATKLSRTVLSLTTTPGA